MNEANNVQILQSEIKKNLAVLKRIENFYQTFLKNQFNPESRETTQAIIISDIICNYYTCLETIFVRISQFFENNLEREKWHQALLQKMTLQIEPIRPAVLRDETFPSLLELLKFRHFKRYYFSLDYDWDKLEFIQKKFSQVAPLIEHDLMRFLEFIDQL